MLFNRKKGNLLTDYPVILIIGIFVLIIGSVAVYWGIKKGIINISSIKNLFRVGLG